MNRILTIIHSLKFVEKKQEIKTEKKFDFNVPVNTDNHTNYSFINQHGSKKRILKDIFGFFTDNYSRFIDGFCGSLSVSMYDSKESEYHCNDGDPNLIFLYKMIPSLTEEDFKSIYNEISLTDRKTFMWFKDNFKKLNGIEKFIGKIILRNFSLYSGEGTYRPVKNNDVYALETIKRIKFFQEKFKKKKFHFYNKNIFDFLDNFSFRKNDFLYLDPPYFGTKQYLSNKEGKKWTDKDLEELIVTAKKTKIPFAISERLTEDVKEIAKKTGTKIVPVKKVQHIKQKATEILILNK